MRSLRVGFNWGMDAFSISNGQFRYAVELFQALADLREDVDFDVFGTRRAPPSELTHLFAERGARWRWHRRPTWPWRARNLADDTIDAVAFRRARLDVLHCIDSTIPPLAPCPLLWTLYDLAPEVMPEERVWRESRSWRRYVRRAKTLVACHLAISHATASDAVRIWGLDPAKITVTQLGTRFPPAGVLDRPPGSLLAALPVPRDKPFLCAAYNLHPRKNMDALLVAMGHLHAEFPELRLVLFGRAGISPEREAWFERAVVAEGIRDAVIRLGFVADPVLADLYQTAVAFVFPSLFEGFGLPLLEAMAVGGCVVARNCSSMAEVVDDAGLLLETKDGPTLARGITGLLRNAGERRRLGRCGIARAAGFTLERLARTTFEAYRQVAARGRAQVRTGR